MSHYKNGKQHQPFILNYWLDCSHKKYLLIRFST
jgi:hypothetical protein